LKYQIRINGKIEKAKEALPVIWKEQDLLELWHEVEKVEIDSEVEYVITLLNRILGFCVHAQHYDASSLTEAQKRELCSKCSQTYICSKIARPSSVRAKLALSRLAKGFAYLRGSSKVELVDIEKAFPLVYWKRLTLMNEDEISNRLGALRSLVKALLAEIRESKEAIELVNELKKKYSERKFRSLENWVNSKAWLREVKEDLEAYYQSLAEQLKRKVDNADLKTKVKIYRLAKARLPTHLAEQFKVETEIEIELNPKNLAKLASIDLNSFKRANADYENGAKTFKLHGLVAQKWLERGED